MTTAVSPAPSRLSAMQRTMSRLLAALTVPSISNAVCHHHCSVPRALRLCAPVVLSRSYLSSSTSSVRTSRLVSTPRSSRDVPLDVVPAPPSAAQTARRNAVSEQFKRDKRNHQQMAYNAYNLQLAMNIKELDSWTAILTLLANELNNTAYNRQTAGLYIHPNKKYTQLTHQTLHAITVQLIKVRRTRRAVLAQPNPRLMHTLAQFVRVLEMAAPAMYEGKAAGGRWRLMYHPYRYLRAIVEQWRLEAENKVKQQRRQEEERKEEEAIRREGVLTPDDIKRRIQEVRKQRMERQAAGSEAEDEEAGRTGDEVVDAMHGLSTAEERRELASMSDDEKLRMQVQAMLEQERDRTRKAKQQQSEEEDEPKLSPLEKRRAKVPVFFTSPH